jgi:hypothetical protein
MCQCEIRKVLIEDTKQGENIIVMINEKDKSRDLVLCIYFRVLI